MPSILLQTPATTATNASHRCYNRRPPLLQSRPLLTAFAANTVRHCYKLWPVLLQKRAIGAAKADQMATPSSGHGGSCRP
jgi:hypothetical protein